MTPMQRYKTAINTFRENIAGHVGRELTLNKSESKSLPWMAQTRTGKSETKGVESDFIIIFRDKSNYDFSFALTFTYIDKPENEQTVAGTIKYGDDEKEFRNGKPLKMEEFRVALNELNKVLANQKNKSFDSILNSFAQAFLKEEFSLKSEVDRAAKDITSFLKEKNKELNVDEAYETAEKAKKAREKAESTIQKELQASDAYIEREKLLERIKVLDRLLQGKETLLKKENKLSEKQADERNANKALNDKKSQLTNDTEKKLEEYPKSVRNRVRNQP